MVFGRYQRHRSVGVRVTTSKAALQQLETSTVPLQQSWLLLVTT